MIKGGWLIQPRKIKESPIYKMPPCTREVWGYLLREAFFTDKGNIKRGQLPTKFDKIREDLSWVVGYRKEMYSRRQIEGAIEALRKVGAIVTTKVTHGTIITICKYDYYQRIENYEGGIESVSENFTKVKRTLSGRGNIKKEGIKNEKEDNNSNTIVKHIGEKTEKNEQDFRSSPTELQEQSFFIKRLSDRYRKNGTDGKDDI